LTVPASGRRSFLITTAVNALAGVVVSAMPLKAVAALNSPADRFMSASRLLTGKSDLDFTISSRTFEALSELDPKFPDRLTALADALDAAGLRDMRDFDRSSAAAQPALRTTAIEIVSAWYLGIVGIGASAKLVTYENALMYRPTRDITRPPATGFSEFGSWAAKP
jgi:hypothetical protein